MKNFSKTLISLCIGSILSVSVAYADNQTPDVTPVLPGSSLPFNVVIEKMNFQLPVGFHSGVVGVYQGNWVFIAGRTNGLHGFDLTGNFPVDAQNTMIYVVNSTTGAVTSRSLKDPSSGLTQPQIDSLSVTSPEGFQQGTTLYMTGGYGVDSSTGTFGTKPILTAINLPGIVQWVTQPGNPSFSVIKNISQIIHPIFQVTGGRLFKVDDKFQLVFGQNFSTAYTDFSNGNYSDQIRVFQLNNVGGQFTVTVLASLPTVPDDADYRRRDLNIVPVVLNDQYGLVAYAGVFTLTGGVWTVPVVIDSNGNPTMTSPTSPNAFKQAMNQYVCPTANLYSRKTSNMYSILFGGLTYGFYSGGTFQTDSEIPFTNEVTTIQMDKNRNFSQYLMNAQYPTIVSTGSNPGNQLLFGAGAYFLPTPSIQQYPNTVMNLDSIRQSTVIGYIVGGIQSTLANTNVITDSSASPYVFKVTLVPNALQQAKATAKVKTKKS